MDKTEEKRRFHRILFSADASLREGEHLHHCQILDLSLKGCLLEFSEALNALNVLMDKTYVLTFDLTEEIHIEMELVAVHSLNNQVGFDCRNIDIESISRLRRLVELNLGDSKILERELEALSHAALVGN